MDEIRDPKSRAAMTERALGPALDLEYALRRMLAGKTLLGEIVYEEHHCDSSARLFAQIIAWCGPDPGRALIRQRLPITYALWLTNEAFFNFESGAYWPPVLQRIGIKDANAYSSRFGQAFVEILDEFRLARFRRLNTRWSYLGPILAHCGVPRSCLPEFFEIALPRALDVGISTAEGFTEFQSSVPQLHLTKATERFLLFGDRIAHDFVQRAGSLYRVYRSDSEFAAPEAVGLAPRVVEAFREWTKKSPQHGHMAGAGRGWRRPVAVLDLRHGVKLVLPQQRCEVGEVVCEWAVQVDNALPHRYTCPREPGQSVTVGREVVIGDPFQSLSVRLFVQGIERSTRLFQGVTQREPIVFFDPETAQLLPRSAVEAAATGVATPDGWTLSGVGRQDAGPRVVADIGRLPFGWKVLTAKVLDLSGYDEVEVKDDQGNRRLRLDLVEVDAQRPRLTGATSRSAGLRFSFVGASPVLELWKPARQPMEEFRRMWSVHLEPVREAAPFLPTRVVALGDPSVVVSLPGQDGWCAVELNQDAMLGKHPWGEFDVRAHGPIGQDEEFHVVVMPHLDISHDWTGWDAKDSVRVTVRVPSASTLRGATPTLDPREYTVDSHGLPVRTLLELAGYGGVSWSLPLHISVPVPAWALYDPRSASHLLEWSREPLRLNLTELDGREPELLLRLATPWGTPAQATLSLAGPHGDLLRVAVALDQNGLGSVPLAPLLASARQRNLPRFDLRVSLELKRLVTLTCGMLSQKWEPQDFNAAVDGTDVCVTWSEKLAVDGRAIRIRSVCAPWNQLPLVRLSNNELGRWAAPCQTVAPQPGLYRVDLGVIDEWSDRFDVTASRIVEWGSLSEWEAALSSSDDSGQTWLSSFLLAAHGKEAASLPALPRDFDAQAMAERVLEARETTEGLAALHPLRGRLDRLLGRLPADAVLSAIAASASRFETSSILRTRVFTRGLGRTGCEFRLTEDPAEMLWALWPPLAAFVELHVGLSDRQGAERRLVRHLGVAELRDLGPFAPGVKVQLSDGTSTPLLSGDLISIQDDGNCTPFDVIRGCPGVAYRIAADGQEFVAVNSADGGWELQFADGGRISDELSPLSASGALVRLQLRYPPQYSVPRYPDPQVLALVAGRHSEQLAAIQSVVLPLPSSPIGDEAFQAAGFEWAISAASDPEVCRALERLCLEQGLPLANEIRQRRHELTVSPMHWRVLREFQLRRHRDFDQQPLLALHYLSWALAMALVWRGRAQTLPFLLQEDRLVDLSIELHRYAPRLLEHDLLLICALEALHDAAEGSDDVIEPGEAVE